MIQKKSTKKVLFFYVVLRLLEMILWGILPKPVP